MSFKDRYGHYPNIDTIRTGESRQHIEEKLGMPSYHSEINDKVWYYISMKVVKNVITSSYSSKVITIEFDEDYKVKDFYETLQEKAIMPDIRKERTPGKGIAAEKGIKDKIIDLIKSLRPSL